MDRGEVPNLEEKTVSSEEIFDGELLHVRRDIVKLPGGAESVREWIDHPGASAVVPIFDDGTTILVRQFRYPARRVFWEVPAGKLDVPGESAEGVARRELEEETGWRASRFEHVGSFYPCIGYSNEIIHTFVAFDLERGTQALSDGELLEPVRMPFDKAIDLVQNGEIVDMKTISALLTAGHYRLSRS
ncbi:MAG: NUDIX hydrolase [Rhodothermales bacterium]|nr:NUDIX hydrolase [Rhodothermales bacterium]